MYRKQICCENKWSKMQIAGCQLFTSGKKWDSDKKRNKTQQDSVRDSVRL